MTTATESIRIVAAGESGVIAYLGDTPSPALTRKFLAICDFLEASEAPVFELLPGYTSLTVLFDADNFSHEDITRLIREAATTVSESDHSGREVSLPVYYAAEVAPDLEAIAAAKGLSVDAIIELHASQTYFAYANGFAPGFCYLGEIDSKLSLPRMQTPRKEVPKGSVAIADRQTAVYPRASPGGWNIIGRCPTPLFDLEASPPNLINVGDQVTFKPVSRQEFLALGGEI